MGNEENTSGRDNFGSTWESYGVTHKNSGHHLVAENQFNDEELEMPEFSMSYTSVHLAHVED
jgi:hypothetical protein